MASTTTRAIPNTPPSSITNDILPSYIEMWKSVADRFAGSAHALYMKILNSFLADNNFHSFKIPSFIQDLLSQDNKPPTPTVPTLQSPVSQTSTQTLQTSAHTPTSNTDKLIEAYRSLNEQVNSQLPVDLAITADTVSNASLELSSDESVDVNVTSSPNNSLNAPDLPDQPDTDTDSDVEVSVTSLSPTDYKIVTTTPPPESTPSTSQTKTQKTPAIPRYRVRGVRSKSPINRKPPLPSHSSITDFSDTESVPMFPIEYPNNPNKPRSSHEHALSISDDFSEEISKEKSKKKKKTKTRKPTKK